MTTSQILGIVLVTLMLGGLVLATVLIDGPRVLWGRLFSIVFTAAFAGAAWLAFGGWK